MTATRQRQSPELRFIEMERWESITNTIKIEAPH
jgi:hypothetical protein